MTLPQTPVIASRRSRDWLRSTVILCALCSCSKKGEQSVPSPAVSQTAAATPGQVVMPVATAASGLREAAAASDYKLTALALKECKVKYYFKPKQGNIKLGVQVSIEGTTDRQVPINPFYAKLTDAEGNTYTSAFAGCEPELKSAQISKGKTAEGWITFEIPEASRGLKFGYSPFVIGGTKEDVTVDLGR